MSMLPLAVFPVSKQVSSACEEFSMANCQFGHKGKPVRIAVPRRSLPTEYFPVKFKVRLPLPMLASSMPPVMFPLPSAVNIPTALMRVPLARLCPEKENAYCPWSRLLLEVSPKPGPEIELLFPPQATVSSRTARTPAPAKTRRSTADKMLLMKPSRHEELLTF